MAPGQMDELHSAYLQDWLPFVTSFSPDEAPVRFLAVDAVAEASFSNACCLAISQYQCQYPVPFHGRTISVPRLRGHHPGAGRTHHS